MRRSEIATQALLLATLVALVVGVYNLIPHLRDENLTPVVLQPTSEESSAALTVHVSGDGTYPGIYALDATTSLAEVLRLAYAGEGETPHTLSIIVGQSPDRQTSQRIDLNHADAWLLTALPGIGPERSQAIVDYRERHGPFVSTEDLTLVPGIGNTTYEALKEFITVT